MAVNAPRFLVQGFKWLMVSLFFLILLGGSVRTMNAGLSCPDWPFCFGKIIPDYHPQVYFEFIHRVFAGIIGLALTVLSLWLMVLPHIRKSIKQLALASMVLLIFQVIMGGLTVLWQIQAKVVTIHLMSGITLFLLVSWIFFELDLLAHLKRNEIIHQNLLKKKYTSVFAILNLVVVYIQILLGGLVASHYAARVCLEFPLCYGQWIPTFSGIIGLHIIHRLGAYITSVILIAFVIWCWKFYRRTLLYPYFLTLLIAFLIQITLGITNVLTGTPPLLAVSHLGMGVIVLWISFRICFILLRRT